jgi:hypothetical protein
MQKKIIRSYKKSTQTSFNSAIAFMSLIRSRLDIQTSCLQRKSPDASHQGFFVDSPKKACFLKGWKQKNPSPRAAWQGFFVVKHPSEDHDPPAGGE